MNKFTIKDIENFTGIKAHTIRIWEQRYPLFQPKRKDTNHRIYDNDDLKALLRIAYLYHHGTKISRIAALSTAEQNKLSLEIAGDSDTYLMQVNELIAATLDYDQPRFESIFLNLVLHAGFEKCITQVIYPYLEKIGVLWLTGNVNTAQEHFSSNIIRTKILVAIDGLPMNYQADDHFLLFLPEGEFHEIPLLYVQYLLKKHGKWVTSFGPNVPVSDLAPFVTAKKITHIYTHMLTNLTRKALNSFVTDLSLQYPHVKILLSGPHISPFSHPLPENVQLLSNLDALTNSF
ncbi:B12 binding protein [Chitinophaga niastensis]|uniref:B12 binding protein n=1 Tax=Chitinophaga niastensis TaxID=536980 RepID=A0A2P8HKC0_CHINA|nr:MerR family transcriptional regulator [Chitinophaga niastensis]PSL46666.1 B12 binding protein [Chitinophaga niastensis]